MNTVSTIMLSDLSTDRRNPDIVVTAMSLAGHKPVSARVEYPTGDVISLDYNTIEEAEAARLFCDGHRHNYRVMKAERWNPQHKFQSAFQDLTNGQVLVSFKGPFGTVIDESVVAKHCVKAEFQDSVQVFIHSLTKKRQPRCEWSGIAFIYNNDQVPFAEYSERKKIHEDGIEFELKLAKKFLIARDGYFVEESPSLLTVATTVTARTLSAQSSSTVGTTTFVPIYIPVPVRMLPCVFVPVEILSLAVVSGGQVCWVPPFPVPGYGPYF